MLTARKNNSSHAQVSMQVLYANGAFKNVYSGVYIEGERKGEQCVSKIFINQGSNADSFFENEMAIVNKAMAIVEKFNNQVSLGNKRIYLNEPGIWIFSTGTLIGQKSLVEPMIQNFEKFNSNSGWVATGTSWYSVMQALSHFSYHATGMESSY